MREGELLDGALLEVKEALDITGDSGAAIGDSPHVICGCDGASTAVVHKSKVSAFDLTNEAILGDTDMGAMDNKTETVVGHVGYHGAETGDASEGEARQATEREVVAASRCLG